MSVAPATKRRSAINPLRYLATGVLVAAALVAARNGWRVYVMSPWTRDGMVRVQVANVAPQISGQIVEVRTFDNQHVRKGDILYVIEKFDFEVALDNAKATILNREADLEVKKAQNARRVALTTLSTPIEEKQVFDGNAKMAAAAYAERQGSAFASRDQSPEDRGSFACRWLRHEPPDAGWRLCAGWHAQRLGDRRKFLLGRRVFRGNEARQHPCRRRRRGHVAWL
jgi:multidrug resistance efflux pump